jgi:hypothetical protein
MRDTEKVIRFLLETVRLLGLDKYENSAEHLWQLT